VVYVTGINGGLGFPSGWENVTFTNWTQARKAAAWLEQWGGSYEEYKDLTR
jgi:hypothetical protein